MNLRFTTPGDLREAPLPQNGRNASSQDEVSPEGCVLFEPIVEVVVAELDGSAFSSREPLFGLRSLRTATHRNDPPPWKDADPEFAPNLLGERMEFFGRSGPFPVRHRPMRAHRPEAIWASAISIVDKELEGRASFFDT